MNYEKDARSPQTGKTSMEKHPRTRKNKNVERITEKTLGVLDF